MKDQRQPDALSGPQIEAVLRGMLLTTPTERPLGVMLDNARQRLVAAGPSTRQLVLRGSLLLIAMGLVTIGLQIFAARSSHGLAQLTPLTQVNAAWAAADGYVLDFTVFDADPPLADSARPNYDRFKTTALRWANRHGLSHREQFGNVTIEQVRNMGFTLDYVGGGRWEGQYTTNYARVLLRLDDATAVQDLVHTVASLPGVAEPEVARQTLYWGIAEANPAAPAAKVIVNGTSYNYPQDFSEVVAGTLYWTFRGVEEYGVTFMAFPEDLLADPTGTQSIPHGDVVRVALDPAGNLVISDVLKHWDVPLERRLQQHQGMAGGWRLTLPPSVDEASIDPVKELSRKIDPLPGDTTYQRYNVHLYWWFIPLQQVLTQGGLSITAQQRQLAQAQAVQLQTAVNAWVAEHPEVKRSLVWHDRVQSGLVSGGPVTLGFAATLSTNDLAEAENLRRALGQIADMPAPKSNIFDLDTITHPK